ncbi:MAG TPA: hypothetical protein VF459_15955 [Caulobacteraceae bacterium]
MKPTIITSGLMTLLLSAAAGLAFAASPHAGAAPGAGRATGAAAAGVNASATATTSHLPTSNTTTTLRGPTSTGQPNQSCGSATAPMTPGNAASAPGSAFNPDGKAGSVYAGQQPQNSRNTASVSQYDAACAHQR